MARKFVQRCLPSEAADLGHGGHAMDREEARERYQRANNLYQQRQYAAALEILDDLHRAFPQDRDFIRARALCRNRLRPPGESDATPEPFEGKSDHRNSPHREIPEAGESLISEPAAQSDRDWDLLFAVFAKQLLRTTSPQLAKAVAARVVEPSKDLGTCLVEAKALTDSDRSLIQHLVNEVVLAYAGDISAALAAFTGSEDIQEYCQGTFVLTESAGLAAATTVLTPQANRIEEQITGVVEAPGRYTTRGEHARGGMGKILLAHDEHLGRDIALKVLLPQTTGAPTDETPVRAVMPAIYRFLQEACVTGQLEHPSIVPVYELGRRTDGSVYYTMKLVRGRTLSEAIRESDGLDGRLSLLPHFVDLCQAIAYAHSRGVIHRDIKPSNVMVGEFGETVVLDWGLAKAKDRPDAHADGLGDTLRALNLHNEAAYAKTAYGHALGTPAYMPPEQVKGDLDRIDERSDVYALGAVLYEILTGRPPHTGDSLQEVVDRAQRGDITHVSNLEPNAPRELAAVCLRALDRDPDKRYPTARELAEEAGRFLSGAAVRAYQYSPREILNRFARRHKAVLLTSCVALVALVSLGILSYLQVMRERNGALLARDLEQKARHQAEDERDRAEAERERAEAAEEEAINERTRAEENLYLSNIAAANAAMSDEHFDAVLVV